MADDLYALTAGTRDRLVESLRRGGDGGATAPRDRGPRRATASLTARTSAANTGTQWTAARLVMPGDPLPPNRGGGAATGEQIEVQPLYGASFTSGGVTFPGHTLDAGNDYPIAHDSGTVSGSGLRRFYVLPVGLIVCDSGTLKGL